MVRERGDRQDNPLDYIDPPRIPQVIQPLYESHEVEAVLKAIGHDDLGIGSYTSSVYKQRS